MKQRDLNGYCTLPSELNEGLKLFGISQIAQIIIILTLNKVDMFKQKNYGKVPSLSSCIHPNQI